MRPNRPLPMLPSQTSGFEHLRIDALYVIVDCHLRAKKSQAADCGHRDLAARPELVRARRVRGEPRTRPLQPNLASGFSRERVEGRLALALRRLVSRHMGLRLVLVRFSNRPSGSSAFRLSTTAVSMSLTGSRFSSDSAPRPFHHGDSKTRWNNLLGGLAVSMTAGPSGQTNSPHPSSREGHHSTVGWSSISSYRI